MHHVVMLLPQRIALTEYAAFANLKAEIQTRSILQHAWAEIEHDLGYKTSHEVPRSIRRRFSRLAGLLELVDQEFERIRDELDTYEREVPLRIAEDSSVVALDKASLASFAASSRIVEEVDRAIGSLRNLSVRHVSARLIELAVARLQALEVHSIRDVESALKTYREEIIAFADAMLPRTRATPVDYIGGGISIFYLCYVMPFHSPNPDALNRLAAVVSSEATAPATAKRLTRLRAESEAKLTSQQETKKARRGTGTPARSSSGTNKTKTKAKGDGRT
jgi:hypothetical protein